VFTFTVVPLPYNEGTKWAIEGLADYVKDKLGLAGPYEGPTIGPPRKQGYQAAARFFEWLEANHPGGTVPRFVAALSAGDTLDAAFQSVFGGTPDVLIAQYKENPELGGATRAARQPVDVSGLPTLPTTQPPPAPGEPAATSQAPPPIPTPTPPVMSTILPQGSAANTTESGMKPKPTVGGIVIPPSTTTPGTSTDGSSSGGSSGGGAPADPDAGIIASATSWYIQAWGTSPPAGYIEKLVHSGMNLYEVQEYERHKPAFLKSEWAKKKADYIAQILNSILGR